MDTFVMMLRHLWSLNTLAHSEHRAFLDTSLQSNTSGGQNSLAVQKWQQEQNFASCAESTGAIAQVLTGSTAYRA